MNPSSDSDGHSLVFQNIQFSYCVRKFRDPIEKNKGPKPDQCEMNCPQSKLIYETKALSCDTILMRNSTPMMI